MSLVCRYVPVQNIEDVLNRMERDDLLKELKACLAVFGIREVGDICIATFSWLVYVEGVGERNTYGHDRMETRAMPIIRAYLTRKDIR